MLRNRAAGRDGVVRAHYNDDAHPTVPSGVVPRPFVFVNIRRKDPTRGCVRLQLAGSPQAGWLYIIDYIAIYIT